MDALQTLSQSLASAVERAGQSVVRVEGRRATPGSGLVWSADGVIVTAEHILERDEEIRVGLSDGRVVNATVIGRDPTTDVAVLRAEASGLTPVSWGTLDGAGVGQLVLALSRPGRSVRARLGIVSALGPAGEAWRTRAGAEVDRYLESDVDVTWGFSGGALLGTEGTVLGMNTAGLMRGAALTIPFRTLERVVGQLQAEGKIRRGFLGIGSHPVRLPAALRERLGQRIGLIVIAVEPGSPAEKSGLVLGDVLLTVESAAVRGPHDIAARLGPEAVGKPLALRLLRGGVAQDITVTVGER